MALIDIDQGPVPINAVISPCSYPLSEYIGDVAECRLFSNRFQNIPPIFNPLSAKVAKLQQDVRLHEIDCSF